MVKQAMTFVALTAMMGGVLGYMTLTSGGHSGGTAAPTPIALSSGSSLPGASEALSRAAVTPVAPSGMTSPPLNPEGSAADTTTTTANTSSTAANAAGSAANAAQPGGGPKQYPAPPEMKIDVSKTYTVTLATTKGDIVLRLFAKEAPKTVNNFVFLVRDGFYDGVSFHRVIPNFMIQGGDRNGNPPGTGGPGYRFEDETNAATNPKKHDKPGILSMANAGPNTNGSQFFVTHVPTPHLDGRHTVFGEVVDEKSMNVVNAIVRGDKINKATVEEK